MLSTSKNIVLENGGREMVLHCPRCSNPFLHQIGIKWFFRKEDDEKVVVIGINGASSHTEVMNNSSSGNPSGRRQGLTIQFSCEICSEDVPGDVLELAISQHKGATLFSWRFTPISRNE